MGRGFRRRKNKNQTQETSKQDTRSDSRPNNRDQWQEHVKEPGNFKLEAYYAAIGLYDYKFNQEGELVPCKNDQEKQEERNKWKETMSTVLPASFRITKDVPKPLRKILEDELHQMLEEAHKTMETPIMKPLEFTTHGYQLAIDRARIRKKPALAKLHEWLKAKTDAGLISRQETVSMIPPVVLAPQPDDAVIDLCAAPGSKTGQLLEDLGPNGSMIANDANLQRAYMLTTQLRRILHINPVAAVTACEAQFFPVVTQFDRVLADVPCSGDGTSRKNIGIWKNWSQSGSLALHALQYQIAWKGAAQLLKVGGYMCYSTCSMNPIEDEAVVAELLRNAEGALELVPIQLVGFRTRPGLSTWKVMSELSTRREKKDRMKKARGSETMQQRRQEHGDDETPAVAEDEVQSDDKRTRQKFEPPSLDEATTLKLAEDAGFGIFHTMEEVPENLRGKIRRSCFPPTTDEVDKFHLDRAVRILPHDNDTGGFFVALIKKVHPISRTDRKGPRTMEPDQKRQRREENTDEMKKDSNQRKEVGSTERFVPVEDGILEPMIEYFGLSNGFRKDFYMARTSDGSAESGQSKVIYYVSPSIKKYIDEGIQDRVNVVNTGLKGFVRSNQDGEVVYRVAQEGIHFLAPFITKRKFVVNREDFEKCLNPDKILIETLSGSLQEAVRPLTSGSFVIELQEDLESDLSKMMLVMWKCRGDSVTGHVSKVELEAISNKLKSISNSPSEAVTTD